MPESSDDFIIPSSFLKQLNEFANGGYILLTFTSQGNPAIYRHYESKKDQLALETVLFNLSDRLGNEMMEEHSVRIAPEDKDDEDNDEQG